jgi:hypothetical protein
MLKYSLMLMVTVLVVGTVGYVAIGPTHKSSPLTPGDTQAHGESFTEHEEGFDSEPAVLTDYRLGAGSRYTLTELTTWQRPEGPLRVGLQVGHWRNNEVPTELANLSRNTGATWGGLTERDVVYEIVQHTAARLKDAGITVDILPTTVPPGYLADAFISVHADGNTSSAANGFKIAGPRRDYAGTSDALIDALYDAYGPATGLREDPSITRRMTAYYAFNWPRYEHAIHPFTPAAIVETGFLTSEIDRAIIVNAPERAAAGIAEGVLAFLAASATPLAAPTLLVPPTFPLTGTVACAPLRAERLANADEYDCIPALVQNGVAYILPAESSSTAPFGSQVIVAGTFRPVQTIDTYFWFPYEVAGFIDDAVLNPRSAQER